MSPKEILFIFAVHSRPLKKYCGIVIENNSNNDLNIGLSARMLIRFWAAISNKNKTRYIMI